MSREPEPWFTVDVPASLLPRLTRREAEVLALFFVKMNSREIAAALGIGTGTVDSYLRNITATVGMGRDELREALNQPTKDTSPVRVRLRMSYPGAAHRLACWRPPETSSDPISPQDTE